MKSRKSKKASKTSKLAVQKTDVGENNPSLIAEIESQLHHNSAMLARLHAVRAKRRKKAHFLLDTLSSLRHLAELFGISSPNPYLTSRHFYKFAISFSAIVCLSIVISASLISSNSLEFRTAKLLVPGVPLLLFLILSYCGERLELLREMQELDDVIEEADQSLKSVNAQLQSLGLPYR